MDLCEIFASLAASQASSFDEVARSYAEIKALRVKGGVKCFLRTTPDSKPEVAGAARGTDVLPQRCIPACPWAATRCLALGFCGHLPRLEPLRRFKCGYPASEIVRKAILELCLEEKAFREMVAAAARAKRLEEFKREFPREIQEMCEESVQESKAQRRTRGQRGRK